MKPIAVSPRRLLAGPRSIRTTTPPSGRSASKRRRKHARIYDLSDPGPPPRDTKANRPRREIWEPTATTSAMNPSGSSSTKRGGQQWPRAKAPGASNGSTGRSRMRRSWSAPGSLGVLALRNALAARAQDVSVPIDIPNPRKREPIHQPKSLQIDDLYAVSTWDQCHSILGRFVDGRGVDSGTIAAEDVEPGSPPQIKYYQYGCTNHLHG